MASPFENEVDGLKNVFYTACGIKTKLDNADRATVR
jgi:hypothetical protein